MVNTGLGWINKSQHSKPFSLLLSIFLLFGCTSQSEQPQPPPSPTQMAAQAVAASPTQTPEPSPTFTPASTNTPAPTVTPIQIVASDYRVSYVAEDDVLNMRSGPGVEFDIVATLPPDANSVQLTSTPAEGDWVEISWQNQTGWVNRYFLTEVVASETFCNDPAARQIVNAFRTALEDGNGATLTSLVHPQRGLLVRLNWWNNEVRFSHSEIPNLFSASEGQNWGYEDGSGAPIEGTFTEIVVPLLDRDFAGDPQIHCNELIAGGTAGIVQLPFEYSGINYYAVHRPATDNELDWGTWVLGIEYWDGKPYLSFLVHYQWEI